METSHNRHCSICGILFENEGLISCPAHSFGEIEADENTNDLNDDFAKGINPHNL